MLISFPLDIYTVVSLLSIFRTIVWNSLSGNFWLSIFGGPAIGSFLYSFCGVMFPWLFLIPVGLHRCLHIWRGRNLSKPYGLTLLWEDCYLHGAGAVLERAITLGLLVQGTKCGPMCRHTTQGGMMSLQLRLLGSAVSANAWSLISTEEHPSWLWGSQKHLQGQQLGTRAGIGGGQSWSCAHVWLQGPATGVWVVAGATYRHTHSGVPGQTARAWASSGDLCSYGGAGCRSMLLWLLGLAIVSWQWVQMTGVRPKSGMYTGGIVSYTWAQWCRPVTEDKVWSEPTSRGGAWLSGMFSINQKSLQIRNEFIWSLRNCNSGDTDLSGNSNVLWGKLKWQWTKTLQRSYTGCFAEL